MKSGSLVKFQPPGHPKVNKGKIGVLLMNLGTPEATSYWPMRRYLKEFLSDPRVIEVNPGFMVVHPERDYPDVPSAEERPGL